MMTPRWQDAIVFLSGAGLVLAFAPAGFFPLAILLPAVLFFFWSSASPARAAWLGFLFGMGLFGAGASWVYVSIHEFGFMPAPMAALLVFLFVAYLALFPAIAGWIQARLLQSEVQRLLFAIPVCWVLAEWFRGWLMTGFPWLHLGYSQSSSVLMNLAPLLGVYGMSLVVALLAVLLVIIVRGRRKQKLLAAVTAGCLLLASWVSGSLRFVEPAGTAINIALLQGNIDLSEKWKPGASSKIIAHYLDLSRRVVDSSAVIVWPEGAIPDTWQRVSSWLQPQLPRRQDGSLPDYLIGTIDSPSQGSPTGVDTYYNAAITVSEKEGESTTNGIYRKQHLVPFGEFLPFKPVFGWLIDFLKIPMSDFSSWQGKQPDVSLAGWPAAVSICYEDAFGEELATTADEAAFLVNVSEDAWFGDSLAPHQRLQMAQVRAREYGRYFVRAANTGVTAVINEQGEVTDSLQQFEASVLITGVVPMSGVTPYVRFGNSLFLALLILLMLPVVVMKVKGKR